MADEYNVSSSSSEDKRNASWAANPSSFGRKMLHKFGWKDGQGLGKNEQGMSTHLRVVRRVDVSLGIGAKSTDRFGEEGYSSTHTNFVQVLANLKTEHGSSHPDPEKKKKKKRNYTTTTTTEDGLILATNRVSAGHAKKMRESKSLQSKSEDDLAAIFGKKRDTSSSSVWGQLKSVAVDADAVVSVVEDKARKEKKDKKKRKRMESER